MTNRKLSLAHWGAFEAELEGGRMVGVQPFGKDARPSPLIRSIPSAVYSEARVRAPMVREGFLRRRGEDVNRRRGGEPFVEVSWDEALDLVAGEVARVKETHGNQAILGGSYGWSSAGRVNHARGLLKRFLFGYGGCIDQFTNYSWGTAMVLLPHVVGDIQSVSGPVTVWPSIIANTRVMLMFCGASLKNSHVTTGGGGTHEYKSWMAQAKEAGVEFICISPVRTDAPEFLKARWIPIRPGSDTAMMLAMAYVLASEGRADTAFLERYATGYDTFRAYVMGETDGIARTPEWAAALTGVPADTIREIAHKISSQRSMLTATWSLQRADSGEQPFWSLIALAAMVGQIGLPGGGFGFGYGSINGQGTPRPALPTPTMDSGRNPLGFSIPVARVSDLLLNPGTEFEFNGKTATYPDVRLVYWAGGNPFHHHQDINRLLKAWSRPETIIVNEVWWTSTARHADIVLPATSPFERNDVGSSPRDRFIIAMPQLVPPQHAARNDYEIFSEIAQRVGTYDAFTEGRSIEDWVRHAYEVSRAKAAERGYDLLPFDDFWEQGYVELPMPEKDFVLYEDFRNAPETAPLKTPSGKIELFSETIAGFGYDDCPGHPAWLPPQEWLGASKAAEYPFHLISNQPATRLHSQLDQGVISRHAKVAGREPAWINPVDAKARGIENGDVVRVFNDRGACLAGAVVTENVMPLVVQIATGAWFDPLVPGEIGSLDKHGNANMLTRDAGTSRLGQGPSALSTLVQVEKWNGDAVAARVTVFEQPQS